MFIGETVSCVHRRDCVLCSEERLCPVFRGKTVSCFQRRDCLLCSEERLCLVFRGVMGFMVMKDKIPANRSDEYMVMKDKIPPIGVMGIW